MRVTRLACIVALWALPLTALPAQAGLLPHRAVYDLGLDQASDRSGITGISGRMVYEFNGSPCEGYTVTFRFVTQIDTENASRLTDQQTTTYEDGEGENFSFVTRSYIDSALDREIRGKASRSSANILVELERPDPAEHELDMTQFPTQHLLELLGKAAKGENFYETTLFDASDNADKVMTTTVIIGNSAIAGPNDPELQVMAPLARDAFWPVDIAYFDLESDEGEELPSYRISFKLHENGVTRDLVMDYGDFTMTGRLVDLALFDPPADCDE